METARDRSPPARTAASPASSTTAPLQVVRPGRMGYAEALAAQRAAADALRAGTGPEVLFLLEHPPVVTLGRRARDDGHLLLSREELEARGFEVVATDRGGDVTYHGPGQVVGYPIFDLRRRRSGPRAHLHHMEGVLIGVLREHYGIDAFRDPEHTGVWTPAGKIAAMGIRVSAGVSLHGFSLNVARDLAGFSVIVPCGIVGRPVATMEGLLGAAPPLDEVMDHLEEAFRRTSP